MVESVLGFYLALSDITKERLDSTRLRNGYRAEGLAVLLGGLFNTFPYTGFSQNVGLVKLSGIKTRLPIYYAAGFLVLLGLLPKFGALAQIIPSPVLGGAMLVMFGFVSIQGMQILARVDFANNEHNFLIAAVSIAAGVGLNVQQPLQQPTKRFPNVLLKRYRGRKLACHCPQCHFEP